MIDQGYPIVPHEIADPTANFCGCLYVEVRGELADLICNEGSVILRSVQADQAATVLAEMAWSGGEVASATCPHLRRDQCSSRLLGIVRVRLREVRERCHDEQNSGVTLQL
jgi:hypothetical protein